MDYVEAVYQVTRAFPREELYGLTGQLRRAVVSIPSNIAEGQGRGTDAELVRYLRIANGSLRESETQLLLARRLGYVTETQTTPLLESAAEFGRLIRGLINSKAGS